MSRRLDYPGPKSRFPGDLIWRLRGHTLRFLTVTARDHGDVACFPIARHTFFILSHPDAIREVLVTQADAFLKGPALRNAKPMLGEGLLTSEGDFHRRQRRLSQPAFHPNRVSGYATMMTEFAGRVADRWQEGDEIDLHREMMGLTLQVVAKALFGAEVEREIAPIGDAMDVTVKMFRRAMSPFGPLLDRLPLPSNFRFRRSHRRLLQTVEGFIAQRRQTGPVGRDAGDGIGVDTGVAAGGGTNLLDLLLAARDTEADGGAMSDIQLRDECLTLFTAGHETTANALTFAWLLISKSPEAEAKLHEELDRVLAGRLPTAGDVEHLIYTRAILAESMRLYPPAWGLGRQAIRDVPIRGTFVPKDAVALVCQWIVHRDPRWWLDPAADRPRWAYFPFGGGARQCIGESFAWTEAILLLATIARRWKIKTLVQGELDLMPTITLRPRNGIPARITRRG